MIATSRFSRSSLLQRFLQGLNRSVQCISDFDVGKVWSMPPISSELVFSRKVRASVATLAKSSSFSIIKVPEASI